MPRTPETVYFEGASVFDACILAQFDLCQRLEDLADSLPFKVDTRAAAILAKQLQSTLCRCHRLEETIIFPLLLKKDTKIHTVLDRLRHEHQEDEDHARDIQESIQAFVTAAHKEDAERLGYMLRCMFIPLRRHLAFECDYVMPFLLPTASQ
tara:strand:+ start:74 stop:529 length:456 start_codon:yes stop_codon:yes gene_type:complete